MTIRLFYPHREIAAAQRALRRERLYRILYLLAVIGLIFGFWGLVFWEVAKSLDR